ncbi:MAG: hypothetical protein ACLTC8_00135 [Lachnospiraceae bacterium]
MKKNFYGEHSLRHLTLMKSFKVIKACYACLHWCPKHATLLRVPFLTHRPQYHHPEVTVSSMKNPSSLVI